MHKSLIIYYNKLKKDITLNSQDDISKISIKITNYIINNYEIKIIEEILNKKYFHLSADERIYVKNECIFKLAKKREELQTYIFKKLYKYILNENYLNIDGFIQFRIKQYIETINECIDIVIWDFILKLEYEQLIDTLIMYVEYQTPLIDEIEIYFINGKYSMVDSNGNLIFSLIEFDYIFLDVLLMIAPAKININISLFNNKKLIEIILKIFQDKVNFKK